MNISNLFYSRLLRRDSQYPYIISKGLFVQSLLLIHTALLCQRIQWQSDCFYLKRQSGKSGLLFANIQLQSMKFERQRGAQVIPDKYELTNQEFLTFRNNPTAENSGRSVYSQQFDYRSLDRYDKTDEKAEPSYNFRKNVKNLRSTDKYRQLKEEAMLFQATQENSQSPAGSVERREELKNRLSKLKKNMKKQLRREAALKEQIAQLEGQLQDLQETQSQQTNDIDELREILQDNEKNAKQIKRRQDNLAARKEQIEEMIQSIENLLESEKTSRSNEPSTLERQNKQLTLGLQEVEDMKQDISERIQYVQEEIQITQDRLKELMSLDEQLRGQLTKKGRFE